jgi:hypothetical protein
MLIVCGMPVGHRVDGHVSEIARVRQTGPRRSQAGATDRRLTPAC